MSLRNIRKVFGGNQLPPPDNSSDEEYEPAYTKKFNKSIYAGLEVSSGNEDNISDNDEKENSKKPEPEPIKKKNNKKKKKQAKVKYEVKDIDGIVKEINAVLGEPEKPVPKESVRDLKKIHKKLFTVRQQDLDTNMEMNRLFGPDDEEENKKRGRQPNLRVIAQKGYIIPTKSVFKKGGLSMIIKERKGEDTYFVFDHNKAYQKFHSSFLDAQKQSLWDPGVQFPLQASQIQMHVEGLLEFADRFYLIEEYSRGNEIIEEIINYMQFSAHCFFSITDIRNRLEYKHMENRAFHIALMKYMHMLTNKACHRTALEIAKLLLNLDPSDPLAVLFIIDTIALRARKFEWLIEAIDYWNEDRDAGFLFNMQYSYALATFEIARQKKETFEEADALIQKAMLKFPTVTTHIMLNAGVRNAKIKDSPLFNIEANNKISSNLKDLINLYAKFVWHKFCEDVVMKWLVRNATILVDKFETDKKTQEDAKMYANVCMNLFQTYPPEIVRHLSIITPLSDLIVDGAVPKIKKVVSYDPAPPFDGVNRYEAGTNAEDGVMYYEIFTSVRPDYELQDASMDQLRREPEIRFLPLLPGQTLEDTGGMSMDSESEIDSDDDSDLSQNQDDESQSVPNHETPSSADSMSVQIVQPPDPDPPEPGQNEQQAPPIVNDEPNSSDDDEIADSTSNIVQGPPVLEPPPTSSDTVMIDSDDESDPIVATLPIRNGTQFYQDLCASFASRESMESSEPIVLSAEIDIERVRRRDFPDDRSYRGRNYCSSCGNEIRPSESSQGTSRGDRMDVDVQHQEPHSSHSKAPLQNKDFNDPYAADNEDEDINMVEDDDDVIVIYDGRGNNEGDEAVKEDDVVVVNDGRGNSAGGEENKEDDVILIEDKQVEIIVIDDDRNHDDGNKADKDGHVSVIRDGRSNSQGDEVDKANTAFVVDGGSGNNCGSKVDKPNDVILIDDGRGNLDGARADKEDDVIVIDDDDGSSINDPEKNSQQPPNPNYFRTFSVIKRLCDYVEAPP